MRKFVLIALAATMLAVGCQHHKATSGLLLSPEYNWIYYNGGPADYAIVSAVKTRAENNLLRVQVELRNLRRDRERMLYKIIWLDGQGLEVTSLSNEWTLRILSPNESIFIGGVAPDTRAVDCRLELQKSER